MNRDRWTAEEYRQYVQTGLEPAGMNGKAQGRGTTASGNFGRSVLPNREPNVTPVAAGSVGAKTTAIIPAETDEPEIRTWKKYKNESAMVDGIRFDSKHEGRVYLWLKRRKESGELRWLFTQVPFRFRSGITYRADFMTVLPDGTIEAVWDAKSWVTARNKEYVMKKKLLKDEWGIDVREVTKDDDMGNGVFYNPMWEAGKGR